MIDYYEVLEVSPEAVREQYYFLANAYHPDKFSGAGGKSQAKAGEKMKEINAAYDVLKNPASRSEYDRQRAAAKERQRAASTSPPPRPAPAASSARSADPPPTSPPPPATPSVNSPFREDELIRNCIAIIRETGQASASLFQKRFRVGYTRAARLIDILEFRGIIGPDRGSGEREILFDIGRRTNPSQSSPPPDPSPPSDAVKNLEVETRRLRAEQQRLEAQLLRQQITTARPVVRSADRFVFDCWNQ